MNYLIKSQSINNGVLLYLLAKVPVHGPRGDQVAGLPSLEPPGVSWAGAGLTQEE